MTRLLLNKCLCFVFWMLLSLRHLIHFLSWFCVIILLLISSLDDLLEFYAVVLRVANVTLCSYDLGCRCIQDGVACVILIVFLCQLRSRKSLSKIVTIGVIFAYSSLLSMFIVLVYLYWRYDYAVDCHIYIFGRLIIIFLLLRWLYGSQSI